MFQRFLALVDNQPGVGKHDAAFLFECLKAGLAAARDMDAKTNALGGTPPNPLLLSLYLLNEHDFYLKAHPDQKEEDLAKDERYQSLLVSISLDKYLTIERLSPKESTFSNRFRPEISTLNLYLSFLLGMLQRYKQGDPRETLVVDMLVKAFSMARCVLVLLTSGFETEAFSTWRTLHENECVLLVLLKGGKDALDSYLRHMRYALAFRGEIKDKDETDRVFQSIKEGMRAHGLKSKDMKRFIEYGWMMDLHFAKEDEGFKLNFRDGVERLAGLGSLRKEYETSSEIAHSSPLLIYSNKGYFFIKALLNLYSSFFRLEKVFSGLYLPQAGEVERERYLAMRGLYRSELLAVEKYVAEEARRKSKKGDAC